MKTIVILGGGIAGLAIARSFEKIPDSYQSFEVILVDRKLYFENNLASVRFLVNPDFHKDVCA